MNILGELRIPVELSGLLRSDVWRADTVVHGDGQRVLTLPGLLAGDETLWLMRNWLTRIGYRPLPAGIRANVQCSERLIEKLEVKLDHAVAIDGRRAHIIGQSRGGMLAHVLAVRRPDLVASVITLGSPINGTIDDFHPLLRKNLNWLSRVGDTRDGLIATSCWIGAPGHPVPDTEEAQDHLGELQHPEAAPNTCCHAFWPDLAAELPTTTLGTAVYSRSDGIVNPRACVAPHYNAIEIRSSHTGMAHSRGAYRAIADALSRAASADARTPRRPAAAIVDPGPPRHAA